jgi:acyl-CoA dehydrogenase
VHEVTIAPKLLRDDEPSDHLWPTEHLPDKLAAAEAKYAEYPEHEVGNL